MTHSLWKFERHARYVMSLVALMMILTLLLLKTGLVSTTPSYKSQAWYSSSTHAGFVITTEYADEAGCRSAEKGASNACRSGLSLTSNESKYRVR